MGVIFTDNIFGIIFWHTAPTEIETRTFWANHFNICFETLMRGWALRHRLQVGVNPKWRYISKLNFSTSTFLNFFHWLSQHFGGNCIRNHEIKKKWKLTKTPIWKFFDNFWPFGGKSITDYKNRPQKTLHLSRWY